MASLAASHELIYRLAHGAGAGYVRAMQEGGHGQYWTGFILTVAGVTIALAAVALHQIRRLLRQTSQARAGQLHVRDSGLGLFGRLPARLWLSVAAGTLVAFVAQENVELVATGSCSTCCWSPHRRFSPPAASARSRCERPRESIATAISCHSCTLERPGRHLAGSVTG